MFFYQKYVFVLLTVVFGCACVSDILIPVPPSTHANLVAKIVSDFALKFIQNQTTFIIMMSASSTPEHGLLHEDIIRNFIRLNNAKFTNLFIGRNIHITNRHSFHLLLIESYKDFGNILSRINRKILRTTPPVHFLTIVTSFNNDAYEYLNHLFTASYDKSIVSINFLLPHHNYSAWLMTTFMPFIQSCNTLRQHNIALLTEQNYSLHGPMHVIYPEKLKDFRQCPIIGAVFNTPPFVIVKSEAMDLTFDGIDTRIFGHFAKKFNFKLIYRKPSDDQGRGTIFPNGTNSGCIKMVVDREANFTSGAYMATPARNLLMLPSLSYVQVALGFAILPSEDISTPLQKLIAPFTVHLWLDTGALIIVAVIVILITKKMTRRLRHFIIGGYLNSSPILNMWNGLLGGSIGNPRFGKARFLSTFARSLLMIWLMCSLILRGSYQGALYDFLKREILSSPLDTITKINQSDCNLVIMSTATASLDAFYFSRSRFLVYNYSQQTIFRQVYNKELSGAVYCNEFQVKYFNLLNAPVVLQMTKDRLFLMSIIIYFNNVSVLQPIFDKEILALDDSGLIRYWIRQFIDERSQSKSYKHRIPKKLTIQNVLAIFEICSLLLGICLLVFALEKVCKRFKWLQRAVESITY